MLTDCIDDFDTLYTIWSICIAVGFDINYIFIFFIFEEF